MIDIVIPFGKGSQHNNIELRYCLRSIQKHLKNYRNIYIIGERPDWLTGVIHIPFKEASHKEKNIMQKVLVACNHTDITHEFLFMNDDHFFRREIDAVNYPNYYNGNLVDWDNGKRMWDPYKQAIKNTLSVMIKNELPAKHFDIHCPIIYNKDLFKNVMGRYDWDIQSGYVVKSLYANTLSIKGQPMNECKISEPLHIYAISNLILDRHVFSVGDRGLNSFMLNLLAEMYPNKSRYEV